MQIINDKILNAIGATHVPRLLVGNKCDLKDRFIQIKLVVLKILILIFLVFVVVVCRVIPTAQGRALAQEWDCRFVECSAKMNQNIGFN